MDDARNVRARLIRRAEIEDAGGGTSDLQMEDVGALLRAAAEEIDRLRAALTVAEEVLALVEHPPFPDPIHHAEVKALGMRIGFGALMRTASAGWMEVSRAEGYPESGAFVAGPCIGTVQGTLKRIRAAHATGDHDDR